MAQFAMLYRSSDEVQRETLGSPEKAKATLTKWRAWFKEMTEKGQLKVLGEPLERTGTLVTGRKKMVTDGPYTESKDVIGGFSIIEAADLEQAARIASGCPILEDGGCVEVRPVRKFDLEV
jgi:hypothetical protein